ncbi:MAG: N-acetylmuramoyl-L-alanine amidase [Neisseria sp.]|nr:N-acetylmuramoyl-L-alanine amidase [Neisseria sp.]
MAIVTLTAGHGRNDPGAVNGDVREADVATEMRDIAAHILRQDYGLTVRTDGVRGENLPLADALKLLDGKVFAVEIHCNASADKSAGGVEALADIRHKGACQRLCAAVSAVTGWKVRGRDGGWKPDSAGQHRRLAYARAGGIVLEAFFISNDAELALYRERKWPICRALAAAIAKEAGYVG